MFIFLIHFLRYSVVNCLMIILKSKIFLKYPEIVFGFNTKIDMESSAPYFFNLSYSVGDIKESVENNRRSFFSNLGLSDNTMIFQNQVHSDIISIADRAGSVGESDAIITATRGLGLAISAADCNAIFVYDPINCVIAGIHSGWKGTERRIASKTIRKMSAVFNSKPKNMVAYLAPSISQANYEVGEEVAALFDSEFVKKVDPKFYLDLKKANFNMLLEEGIRFENIQKSDLCTFAYSDLFHSYRRDGLHSGRSLGIIAMKGDI